MQSIDPSFMRLESRGYMFTMFLGGENCLRAVSLLYITGLTEIERADKL